MGTHETIWAHMNTNGHILTHIRKYDLDWHIWPIMLIYLRRAPNNSIFGIRKISKRKSTQTFSGRIVLDISLVMEYLRQLLKMWLRNLYHMRGSSSGKGQKVEVLERPTAKDLVRHCIHSLLPFPKQASTQTPPKIISNKLHFSFSLVLDNDAILYLRCNKMAINWFLFITGYISIQCPLSSLSSQL